MGEEDTRRQALNVARMRLLGAEVVPVTTGTRTLKDAINEAFRDWVTNVETTHYVFGSVAGPHPFPAMVRDFQRVIGDEAREQCSSGRAGCPTPSWPASAAAPTRSASSPRSSDDGVAAGRLRGRRRRRRHRPARRDDHRRARRACCTAPAPTCCRTKTGRPSSRTRSAPAWTTRASGPEHAYLHDIGRAEYRAVTDAEAMEAFALLCRTEGIIPAIESRARPGRRAACSARSWARTPLLLVNLSGRGDKDVETASRGSASATARTSTPARASTSDQQPTEGAVSNDEAVAGRTRGRRHEHMLARSAHRARRKAEGRAALIAYLPVGYPTSTASIEAMRAAVEAGADVVEVGVPYSDPGMDGPVIQQAVDVAVRAGVGMRDVLRAVEAVAAAGAAAVVMSYWNPVERYGVERFATDLAAAGGAGAITPDLIPDEAAEWIAAAERARPRPGLPRRAVVHRRAAALDDRACRGFVYAASTMGVTGTRATVERRRREAGRPHPGGRADLPVCVGLGVCNGAQAAEVAAFADGVIVGSAFVRRAARGPRRRRRPAAGRRPRRGRAAGARGRAVSRRPTIPSPTQGVWQLGPLPIRAYALCIIAGVVVAVGSPSAAGSPAAARRAR